MSNFFTKEVKIALSAIVAIVMLVFAINFLKGIDLFKKSNIYYVKFENVGGLSASNVIFANGYAVGNVQKVAYPFNNNGPIVVTISLDQQMRVPAGTRAELESSLMGETKMNLVLGDNPIRYLSAGDTIYGGFAQGALAKIQDAVPQIVQMLPKLDSILINLNKLTSDPALLASIKNMQTVTSNLTVTTARVNNLLGNDVPQLTKKFNAIGTNVENLTGKLAQVDAQGTLDKANKTLESVNMTVQSLNTKLNSKDNSFGLLLNDRLLYDNLNHMFVSLDTLLVNVRQQPKRYVHFSIFGSKTK